MMVEHVKVEFVGISNFSVFLHLSYMVNFFGYFCPFFHLFNCLWVVERKDNRRRTVCILLSLKCVFCPQNYLIIIIPQDCFLSLSMYAGHLFNFFVEVKGVTCLPFFLIIFVLHS